MKKLLLLSLVIGGMAHNVHAMDTNSEIEFEEKLKNFLEQM